MGLAETAELAVRISLKDNVSAGVRKLQGNLGGLNQSLARTGKGVGQIGAGIARAGLVIGGVAVTGLVAATKAAIDFQDAASGIAKTIEASPAELQKLNDQLKQLSTRIPVKYEDLAGIAQEAGALGVPTKEVAGFTEVVARLSAATVGLSTEAAAEAFGKLGNVLKIHGPDFERAGSSLVALGNAGASSEGDIVEVAKRFGAAGAQAGLSTAQVLGFSSAIASMGVEPEAAGSSLSRIFNNITKYIATGNLKIEAFSETTGVSVKKFKEMWSKDASGAIQLFLTNLSKLDKFQAGKVLDEGGIHNVRDINAILLLARGHGELARQLELSIKAYKENTALAEVSARRFDNVKSRLIELKNAFVLSGVTIAEGFLPALDRSIKKLSEFLALDSTKNNLKLIGEDIGKAIDGIDWNAVLRGAGELVSILKGALSFAKLLYDAFSTLPGPIKEATAGFLVLNKLSGNLLAVGAGNVIGGLAGAAATGVAARAPGVGRLFAQPVYVVNFPPGFGAGGALGGLGAAGGAGFGAMVGGILRFAIPAIGAAALLSAVADFIGPGFRSTFGVQEGAANPTGKFGPFDVGGSAAAQFRAAQAMEDLTKHLSPATGADRPNRLGRPVRPTVVDSIRTTTADMVAIEAALKRGRAAGFSPTFAAAQQTLQRAASRAAERQKHAADRLVSAALVQQRAGERLSAIGLFNPKAKLDIGQITDLRWEHALALTGPRTRHSRTDRHVPTFGDDDWVPPPYPAPSYPPIQRLVVPAPITNVTVNVSPTGLVTKYITVTRSGPSGGSRETSSRFHGPDAGP